MSQAQSSRENFRDEDEKSSVSTLCSMSELRRVRLALRMNKSAKEAFRSIAPAITSVEDALEWSAFDYMPIKKYKNFMRSSIGKNFQHQDPQLQIQYMCKTWYQHCKLYQWKNKHMVLGHKVVRPMNHACTISDKRYLRCAYNRAGTLLSRKVVCCTCRIMHAKYFATKLFAPSIEPCMHTSWLTKLHTLPVQSGM